MIRGLVVTIRYDVDGAGCGHGTIVSDVEGRGGVGWGGVGWFLLPVSCALTVVIANGPAETKPHMRLGRLIIVCINSAGECRRRRL